MHLEHFTQADPWAVVKKAEQQSETVQVEVKSLNKGNACVFALGRTGCFVPPLTRTLSFLLASILSQVA